MRLRIVPANQNRPRALASASQRSTASRSALDAEQLSSKTSRSALEDEQVASGHDRVVVDFRQRGLYGGEPFLDLVLAHVLESG